MTTFRAEVFVACCCLASLVQAETVPTYTLTDLGILPGKVYSYAYDLGRTTSHVAGMSRGNQSEDIANYLYTPQSGMQEITIDAPGVRLLAEMVNDRGQVGLNGYGQGEHHSFIWQNGQVTRVGTVAQGNRLSAINSHGVAVGYQQIGNSSPFVWDATNGWRSISVFGTPEAPLYDINDHGVAVGRYQKGFEYRTYLYDTGTNQATDLGNFGLPSDAPVFPRAINDHGHIVAHGSGGSYFLEPNRAVDLGSLSEPSSVYVYDLNNADFAVGAAYGLSGPRGFIWHEDVGMVDLNTRLTAPNWRLTDMRSINELGQIAGIGELKGIPHAVLLTPVPEPTTIVLIILGGLSLLFAVWQRRR
ncbi:MAG: PEP-CTERM sorting domain-containing protein [Candidatus Andersenbacteria bacterium]